MLVNQSRPNVNGVVLTSEGEQPDDEDLRQRACTELLRQAAMQAELLDSGDPAPISGAISPEACTAIEELLERELKSPEPDQEACQRYYTANQSHYAVGERVQARHVLFAVTPGVDVSALRKRAEACLLDLRCPTEGEDERFAQVAGDLSNCPSGANGGDLGWLSEHECAPEFARSIFGHAEVGVLPQLVHSRFGLHVIEVLAREAGTIPPFETVRQAVVQALERQRFATSLRQYLKVLAGESTVFGVDIDAAATPLVQ